MTQPDRLTPDGAANKGSFAAFAATTEDEWREQLRLNTSSHLEDAKAGFGNIGADIGETIDNIVRGLFGWIGSSWSHEDSLRALLDQAATTSALSSAIAKLQNGQTAAAIGGNSAFIDFALRDDAGSLGSDFDQTYDGDGTGTWGIESGRAVWDSVSDAPRSCIAVFDEQSVTDYQLVGASMATSPVWFNSVGQGRNILIGRSNSAGTEYVYADFGKYDVELGCVVSGVKHVFDTVTGSAFGGFSFKSNTIYWLQCGTADGARVFQVLEDTTPIITHTEVGTTSQMDGSHRYSGMGVRAYATFLGTSPPGKVSAWAFSDNNTPDVVGSGSVMYRASGTNVGISSGTNNIASSFFDTQGDTTGDITSSLVNGRFTVKLAGWYRARTRIKVASGTFPQHLSLILNKNGSEVARMGPDFGLFSNVEVTDDGMGGYTGTTGGSYIPQSVAGEADVYLAAGDYLSLAYEASSTAGNFEGAAGGSQTYFSITMINRSLL